LAVLADRYQETGDPRGELLALDLELANVVDDLTANAHVRAQLDRRSILRTHLAQPFLLGYQWGHGFVRRLGLDPDHKLTEKRAGDLEHASLQLLTELRIAFRATGEVAALVAHAPRALRKLEIVSIGGGAVHELGALAHPRLRRIELGMVREVQWRGEG